MVGKKKTLNQTIAENSKIEIKPSSLLFPALVIVSCLLAKWWHISSTNHDLLFLLTPLNFLVSLFTGSIGFFDAETGFFHSSLGIAIDKSCAGFNFLVIAFGSIFSMLYRTKDGFRLNLYRYISALSVSYLLVLTANTSRILVSIKSLHFSGLFPWLASNTAHEVTGSFIFISALLIACLFIHYLKTRNT